VLSATGRSEPEPSAWEGDDVRTAVIRPSLYTGVGGHFPESGLDTFLRAIGHAVRVAISARRARSGRTDPRRRCSVVMAPPRVSHSTVALQKNAATASPPGYRERKAASTDRGRETLIAAVASLIANRPITTGGWGGWVTKENKRSVPRHWVGDPALLPCVHALEKSAPQATIGTFEKWLRKQGIDPFPGGNGSHRRFEYAGRRDGYGVSGNSNRLYFKDAKRLAKFFGYPTVQDFLIAVSTKAALPARAEFELAAA
jgi:hypothetical protein